MNTEYLFRPTEKHARGMDGKTIEVHLTKESSPVDGIGKLMVHGDEENAMLVDVRFDFHLGHDDIHLPAPLVQQILEHSNKTVADYILVA